MSFTDSIKTLRARWVLPIHGPPIEGGAVTIHGGRIAFVGRTGDAPAGPVEDLGDHILLPGFVNAHTHLELGWCRGVISSRPLWDWFDELLLQSSRPDADERRRASVTDGAAESIASGVTCLGDISRTGVNAELLAASPIRKVCFVELISGARTLPNDAASLDSRVRDLETLRDDDRLRLGVSPHALYSVSASDLGASAAFAAEHRLPLTIHFLETEDEARWLRDGGGRVAQYLARYGLRRGDAAPGTDAVSCLADLGVLALRPLLAHLNYVTDDQIHRLAGAGASVVWCPRTHAYFGHRPHRWRDLLDAGVNVCLGTDSLASAPTLSILDELRHVHAASPDADASGLVEMATRRGAEALGFGRIVGTLSTGKLADMVAMPWVSDGPREPTRNLLAGRGRVSKVWLGGQIVHG